MKTRMVVRFYINSEAYPKVTQLRSTLEHSERGMMGDLLVEP